MRRVPPPVPMSLLAATLLLTAGTAALADTPEPAPAAPAAIPAASPGPAPRCAPIDEGKVAAMFDQWNLALATLDPAKVTARYWPNAVLLPTVSNTPRTNPALIQDYFEHFLQKHPRGYIESRTVDVGCNLAVDMGTYTFSLMDDSGRVNEVHARYTYVYEARDGQWKIIHHHSSAMPEPMGRNAGAPAHAATGGHGTAAPAVAATGSGVSLDRKASPDIGRYYPIAARARGEHGSAAVKVCVNPKGHMTSGPEVVESSGSPRLDEAAQAWARDAKWTPGAAEGCTQVRVAFSD
jgi:uncharacterized protein (TIGR02246 family)